jgi:hypothetical protein
MSDEKSQKPIESKPITMQVGTRTYTETPITTTIKSTIDTKAS